MTLKGVVTTQPCILQVTVVFIRKPKQVSGTGRFLTPVSERQIVPALVVADREVA